jgi:hypothetical protein
MSGRRSISEEGSPAGTSAWCGCSVARPRAIGQVAAQQHADEVLLLRDLPLERRDLAGRAVDQLLGLAHVEQGRHAASFAYLGQLQRLLPRRECSPRNIQFQIQRAQAEVRARDLADQGGQHRPASPLCGEQLSAGRFGGTAELAPEIELPRRRTLDGDRADVARRKPERDRRALAQDVHAGADRRKLIRVRHAELRLRFEILAAAAWMS